MIERHYVEVVGRQVHYRRAGSGIPVILLHASPMSSAAMEEWIRALADRATVFALDTAGYGQSEPLDPAASRGALPGDGPYTSERDSRGEPGIDAYARSVLEFADALGLDRFLLAGTHTGSKIALSVAVQAPQRVVQLVMDGLALYTEEEAAEHLERYTVPVEPVWHGGHLLEAWHRTRNMWVFWPWYRQEADRRLVESVPDLDQLNAMVFDMLRADPDWGLAYRAAFRYDTAAALAALRSPAVLLAKEADPLHEHLARLGGETPTLTVRSVSNKGHVDAVIAAFDLSLDLPAPPPAAPSTHRGGTSRRYVRTSQGLVHVRLDGEPGRPVLLLLHGSPGSADSFAPLIAELAKDHLVVAPDMLGNGYSDPPAAAEVDIAYYGAVTGEVLDGLGLGPVLAIGSHTGACVAVELALARPELVSGVVADGLPDFDDELRADLLANYLLSLAPQRNGEHLIAGWHLLRDAQLFWPWHRDDVDHLRPTGTSSVAELHHLFVQFLKSGDTYRLAYRAAFLYDSRAGLAKLATPTLVCAVPADMLREGSEEMARESGSAVTFTALEPAEGRDAAWAVREHGRSVGVRG